MKEIFYKGTKGVNPRNLIEVKRNAWNEDLGTFCKSAGTGGGGGEKSNEEALWLRHER